MTDPKPLPRNAASPAPKDSECDHGTETGCVIRDPKRPNPRLTDEESRAAGKILAEVLGEADPRVAYLLARIVFVAGAARAQALLTEARTLEAAGGLPRADGQRRTLGGVFFHLAKRGPSRLTNVEQKRAGLYGIHNQPQAQKGATS